MGGGRQFKSHHPTGPQEKRLLGAYFPEHARELVACVRPESRLQQDRRGDGHLTEQLGPTAVLKAAAAPGTDLLSYCFIAFIE